jgi:hypothetical protein
VTVSDKDNNNQAGGHRDASLMGLSPSGQDLEALLAEYYERFYPESNFFD